MRNSHWLTTCAWLVRDTFRQAMAHGIALVLLAISLMSILVCLSLSVEGRPSLAEGDENPDFLSRRDPEAADHQKLKTSGVTVADGRLTLAFGAIEVPLARDTRSGVRFLQLVLAGGVADTLGLMLTLIWTAGFLPGFLDRRNISVLLAKPAPRWSLILGKYVGVLAFVLANAILFVGGTWLAIGARTGFWDPSYLWCVPLLLLHFAIFYGFSVLLAVCTGNTVVCVFGSLVFWLIAWSINFGRHAFMTSTDMMAESVRSGLMGSLIDFCYWIMPKPADLGLLFYNTLGAGEHFGNALDPSALALHGFSMTLSVLSSIAFTGVLLFLSARTFSKLDY